MALAYSQRQDDWDRQINSEERIRERERQILKRRIAELEERVRAIELRLANVRREADQ